MSIKTPRLIRDRCGVYYFRLIVPLSWRQTVGKTEIRRSLRTKDAAIARQTALLLSARMEALMTDRKNSTNKKMEEELLGFLKTNDANKMRVNVYTGVIETDTLEEAKEARAIVAEYMKGHPGQVQQAMGTLPSSRCGTNLEKAKDDYLNERKVTLQDSTWRKHRGVLQAFIKEMGNIDVAMVSALTVGDFKKKLLALNRAATTVNDQMTILGGFFDYCIDNQVVNMVNPAKGLFIVGASNKAESYEIFKAEELQKIFEPTLYCKQMDLPDFYWGPLIALFTGARIEEVASLDIEQIYEVKGIWIIDILKGKTDNAQRRVPVHDQLMALGLVDYVQSVCNAGYKKLFPHIQPGTNGYRKNLSRMFGTYLDLPQVNIVDPLKVFHSFRHTVVTALTNAGVNDGLKRALVGHDIDTRTSSHDDYIHTKALTLPNLQTAINTLHYEGIDFEKMKRPDGSFLPLIAKRIIQQAEQKKKKAEKAAAMAKAESEAKAKAEASPEI